MAPAIVRIVAQYLHGRYFEPFLGGGAVFFALSPKIATLSDVNPEIANVYRQVRDNPDNVIEKLKLLKVNKESYHEIRDSVPLQSIDRAVRFLFLNRTAFSGLYRLNRAGRFNVPYGGGDRKPDILWEKGLINQASRILKGKEILCCDFSKSIERANAGDVVYCDPAYTVMYGNNGFRRYNESIFSWSDQERPAIDAAAAVARGALVVVSNAYHRSLLCLYSAAEIYRVTRHSRLSPDPEKRRKVYEYVFVLRPRIGR